MTLATTIVRACGTAATVAGAASIAGRTMRRDGHVDPELARLDVAFRTHIGIQLETARRYDHPFTITSTELDMAKPARTALAVEQRIRVLDALTVVDDTLAVLWWNTDLEGATTGIRRLVAAGALPASSLELTGAATFPIDGFTEAGLVEAAAGRRHGLPPGVRSLHAVPDPPPTAAAPPGPRRPDRRAPTAGHR